MRKFKTRIKKYVPIIFLALVGIFFVLKIKEYALRITLPTDNYNYESIKTINLTEKQKLNDLKNLWEIINESVPDIKDYERIYGISYSYKKYETEVLNSKSDLEYYLCISSILNDIPSRHTQIMFPDYNYISNYVSYNYENVLAADNLKGYCEYWYNLLKSHHDLQNYNNVIFSYVDGKYIYNASQSNTLDDKYMFAELISIDGIEVDSAIKDIFSSAKLTYDFIKNKPYRNYIYFNSESGQKHKIKLKKADGEIFYADVYTNLCSEYTFMYSNMFSQAETQKTDHYAINIDHENQVTYIRVNDFSNEYGTNLYKDIVNCVAKYDNKIILDMRSNMGGTIDYGKKFLYPALFSEDIESSNISYMICSKNNKKVYKNPVLNSIYKFKSIPKNFFKDEKKYMQYEIFNIYNGHSEKRVDIYILISSSTVSAADNFVSSVKTLDNVTLIGTNTGGEGIMNPFFMDILPESNLTYIYNPSKALNTDGTSNSIFGTKPDIYSELSTENYIKMQQIVLNNNDPYTYENRLKWDSVLIETLEIIKEKENAE